MVRTDTDWWYTYPSEKYDFVSWDDDIPNWMESHEIPWFQTSNQDIPSGKLSHFSMENQRFY